MAARQTHHGKLGRAIYARLKSKPVKPPLCQTPARQTTPLPNPLHQTIFKPTTKLPKNGPTGLSDSFRGSSFYSQSDCVDPKPSCCKLRGAATRNSAEHRRFAAASPANPSRDLPHVSEPPNPEGPMIDIDGGCREHNNFARSLNSSINHPDTRLEALRGPNNQLVQGFPETGADIAKLTGRHSMPELYHFV